MLFHNVFGKLSSSDSSCLQPELENALKNNQDFLSDSISHMDNNIMKNQEDIPSTVTSCWTLSSKWHVLLHCCEFLDFYQVLICHFLGMSCASHWQIKQMNKICRFSPHSGCTLYEPKNSSLERADAQACDLN